jgi:hypothetical protein
VIRTADDMVARVLVSYQYTSGNLSAASLQATQRFASTNVYLSPGYTYSGAQYVQQWRTRVEIDLNVRVRGNDTFVAFDDVSGPIAVGEGVEVFESESGVSGDGRITEIDGDRELVYLSVDWSSLSESGSSSNEEMPQSASATQLLFVGTPTVTTTTTAIFPQESWIEMVPRPCLAGIGGSDREMWITAPLHGPYDLLTGRFPEPYVEMRQNVVFGNSLVVAA